MLTILQGHVYDLGDFIVRAGNIMVANSTYKGMLIEVNSPNLYVLGFTPLCPTLQQLTRVSP